MKCKFKLKLSTFCLLTSAVNLLLFHLPFFRHAAANVNGGFNAVAIITSLAVIMFCLNWFASYLLLYLGRMAGKIIFALSFLLNAVSLYFINSYDVILDDTMMGNVFNTNGGEAGGYFSVGFLLYLLFLGLVPAALTFLPKLEYGGIKRFFSNIGLSLGLTAAIAFANITNWPWIDNNSTVLGSLILPWSYVVNSIRYKVADIRNNREEILLPDAHIADSSKKVAVLVIGESARRDHFSLYGYERRTNPLLEKTEGLKTYIAESAATYTTAGVKAILDHKPSDKLYEILPNYLFRAGVDVSWRTSNWGQSPLHIDKVYDTDAISQLYPGADPQYDGILLEGLDSTIRNSTSNKVLVVIHTSISHGPSYEKRYPSEFEVFKPVNHSVEMSSAVQSELFNSYDNSIIYTDWFLHRIITALKGLPAEWDGCMMYVSDHGESLGEGKLYMHGVPIAVAPKEQYEIPFILWCSDSSVEYKDIPLAQQYNVFHSILHFLGIDSPVYDETMSLFENTGE